MGIAQDVKVETAAKAARQAAAKGRHVLVYRQNVPWSKSGWSGEVGDMGEVIEAIEALGWQLDHMSYDGQQSANGGCLLLFRRNRQATAAQPQPAQQRQPAPPAQQWQQPQPGYGQQPGLGQLAQRDPRDGWAPR